MQFVEWENIYPAPMPATFIDTDGLKSGDDIRMIRTWIHDSAASESAGAVQVLEAQILEAQVSEAQVSEAQILARLRTFRGRLPARFRFDRLAANERR